MKINAIANIPIRACKKQTSFKSSYLVTLESNGNKSEFIKGAQKNGAVCVSSDINNNQVTVITGQDATDYNILRAAIYLYKGLHEGQEEEIKIFEKQFKEQFAEKQPKDTLIELTV